MRANESEKPRGRGREGPRGGANERAARQAPAASSYDTSPIKPSGRASTCTERVLCACSVLSVSQGADVRACLRVGVRVQGAGMLLWSTLFAKHAVLVHCVCSFSARSLSPALALSLSPALALSHSLSLARADARSLAGMLGLTRLRTGNGIESLPRPPCTSSCVRRGPTCRDLPACW